ncbi:MAG: DNA repair protein RadC [Pseudomonadales bacterium]|nr:JAB domain-containing protein [Pseudomonadales bacterium]NIX07618.1 DNA repair protein RadC [Pseudomonadales bacterium]
MANVNGPDNDPPRNRLLEAGPERLTDAELVAVCLRTGHGPQDPVAYARSLLQRFGHIGKLLDAPPRHLLGTPGMGPAKAAALKASLGVADRYLRARLRRGPVMGDSRAVTDYLRHQLGGLQREVFACLFLDARHRFIAFERLFLGSLDRASVHPREVLKRALELNAAAVIFAHNHPSGVAEPSASDIQITEELKLLLERLEVRVLDHVVIGCGCQVSFAERGLL